MFYNLKIAFRNLRRNALYSWINIFGLSLGIAAATLLFLWVEDEMMFNRTFPKSNELYSVGQIQKYGNDTKCYFVASNPVATSLAADYPGIKNVTRYYDNGQELFSKEDEIQAFKEEGCYVDSSIFDMLDIELAKGSMNDIFAPANAIAISEVMAKKIFGNDDPIGKSLKMNNNDILQITGVFKEPAENSSFSFQWLIPFTYFLKNHPGSEDSWNNFMTCYVELEPSVSPDAINKKLNSFFTEKLGKEANAELFIYPLKDLRLYGEFKDGKFTGSGEIRKVRLFTAIACIILLIACINFMNIATARSQKRAMEVVVKKTFGAKRRWLISQFMSESVVITFISILFALLVVGLSLPFFNNLIGKSLEMAIVRPTHLLGILGVAILCTLLAGGYPAFYLSSFNPMDTLKIAKNKGGSAVGVRKSLVVFQFAVAYILICATLIIYLQIRYAENRPQGYNTEQVVRIDMTNEIRNNSETVMQELQNTGVVTASALSDQLMIRIHSNGWGYRWQGMDPNTEVLVRQVFASSGLVETLQLNLKEGRDFYTGNVDQNSILINKSLADMMGEEGRVGKMLDREYWDYPKEIVGVVDNIVSNDVFAATQEPMLINKIPEGNSDGSARYLFIRLKPEADIQEGLNKISSVLKRFNPELTFDYTFMDEEFDRLFKNEKLIQTLATLFAVLAVIISCLGLFGLSAFSAEQRTKEIGIRKVLGASVGNLMGLLIRDFMIWVGLSFIIGIPVAWYITDRWLENYEYRIDESWLPYALIAFLLTIIAIITVGFQTIKAATANPVKSIKTE